MRAAGVVTWSVLAAVAVLVPGPARAQLLEVSPNLRGTWTAGPGVVHFHVLHRFEVTDPPARKVLNTPTFLVGTGVVEDVMVGGRYATSSLLVPGRPNEWELFARWAPVHQERWGVRAAARAGWNGTAESVDGEVALARSLGPVSLEVAGRAFSAWAGGEGETAVAGGVVWRLHRWVSLAADAAQLLDGEAEASWSAGLQLGIPYTPHTLSLHASNANAITLQSATVGIEGRRLWGFEFTIPVTLSRYLGGRPGSGSESPRTVAASAAAASDTVTVGMDDRLRFLPDTVRIRTGQAVRWENGSTVIHTVTADAARAAKPGNVRLPEGASPFDSGDILPGAVFVRTFTVPGTYGYVCVPHELAGMVGVVVVEGDPTG